MTELDRALVHITFFAFIQALVKKNPWIFFEKSIDKSISLIVVFQK